jgi:hypothetical protein
MPLSEQATDFLKYAFAETKDLSKHSLTVVTAVLVFSLTFSEKIASFSAARPVVCWSFVAAWCCMFLAIVSGGIAICYVALSGGAASSNGDPDSYWHPMRVAMGWLLTGGGLFVASLIALILAAVVSVTTQGPSGH